MNFPFYIARRYLFSKKSHTTINVISAISVGGVTLATLALVCTLSVFNGFHDLVASLFTSFDPELKIIPSTQKFVPADTPAFARIRDLEGVAICAETLEDHALMQYRDRQAMVTIKGVSDNFVDCTDLDEILYGSGQPVFHADVLEFGILGLQLASDLGVGLSYSDKIAVFAPRRGERVNMINPADGFNQEELLSSGLVFTVGQKKYDANYALTSIGFARTLFDKPGMVSSLEIRLTPDAEPAAVKAEIAAMLGEDFLVKDRYEQQQEVFSIMKIEKLMAYFFLTFILLIACFNIIGSLSMLIIDKKDDVLTLRNLGATDSQIRRIFLFEGRLISTFGATFGIAVGLLLCWLQQEYGLLKLGNAQGNFLIDAYPVSVHAGDIAVIFVTVLLVGYLAVWYPVRYFARRLL